MNHIDLMTLKEHFKGVNLVTLLEIKAYLINGDPSITDNAVRKIIFRLKDKGHITSIKRGVYTFISKPEFIPEADQLIQKIYNTFKQKYPLIPCCIWSTQWLHQFMDLQPFQFFYVFETEKDLLEPTFFYFKEQNLNAYLKPDRYLSEKYMAESYEPMVIKLLNTRSPLVKGSGPPMASLEKLLVDIFCDRDIFFFYQGNELINIFKNSFKTFHINQSVLFNYADRRKQKIKMIDFLKNQVEIPLIILQ
jgi:hypothetical protein